MQHNLGLFIKNPCQGLLQGPEMCQATFNENQSQVGQTKPPVMLCLSPCLMLSMRCVSVSGFAMRGGICRCVCVVAGGACTSNSAHERVMQQEQLSSIVSSANFQRASFHLSMLE